MARTGSRLLALALGFSAAIALVSCGGGAKLLSGDTAREITENLEAVKRLTAQGQVVDAEDAAQQVSTQVEGLRNVDPTLQQELEEGAERLNEVVATCTEASTEETTEETLPTTEAPAKPEKKPKKPKPEKDLLNRPARPNPKPPNPRNPTGRRAANRPAR